MPSIPTAMGGPTGIGTVSAIDPSVITPDDISNINQQMQDVLLKNIQLHDALANSIQVAPSARQAAVSQNTLQARQANDELGLEPKAVQAKSAALDQQIQLTPLQTEQQAGDINNKIALQPGERNIGMGQQAVTAAGLSGQIPEADLIAQEMQADPTGSNSGARTTFQSIFHSVPKNDDGSINYKGMQDTLARVAMLQMNAQNPAIQALYKSALDKNRPDLALKLSGLGMLSGQNGQSFNDIIDQIQNAPSKLSGDQQQQLGQDIDTVSENLQKLNELRNLVNTPGVVGSKIGSGDIVGTNMAHLKAWLGSDASKYNDQKQVEQASAQQIGQIVNSLKGVRSAQVLMDLEQQIPKIGDNSSVWNNYLDDKINASTAALKTMQSQLPNGVSTNPAPAPAPAPAAQGNAPADMKGRVVVKTQADYDALRPGQKYVDSFGVPGTKH